MMPIYIFCLRSIFSTMQWILKPFLPINCSKKKKLLSKYFCWQKMNKKSFMTTMHTKSTLVLLMVLITKSVIGISNESFRLKNLNNSSEIHIGFLSGYEYSKVRKFHFEFISKARLFIIKNYLMIKYMNIYEILECKRRNILKSTITLL